MFNKLEFNNLVISNKRKIQRAKTQTIQKLVQKIKKLKYLLDKKPDHVKNKERYRKATLSFEELKKLKSVDLMKHVLVLEKSPSAILTNGLCSPEEMAFAMLAVNKIIHELVSIFREKLQLDDGNQAWKKELMQTSRRRIKILRTEQKRKSRQDLKAQKIIARKRTEWLQNQSGTQTNEDKNKGKDLLDEGANISTLGYWKIESIEDESSKKSKKQIKDKKIISKVNRTVVSGSSPSSKSGNVSKNTQTVLHQAERNTFSNAENEAISKYDDSVGIAASDFNINLESRNSPEKTKEDITHVVDPFFITNSGENYRSSAVIIRNGNVLDLQANENNEKSKADGNAQKRPRNNYNKRENSTHFKADYTPIQAKNVHRSVKESHVEGFHPSWEAKKKFKAVIGSFQGKKIKFEDGANNDVGVTYQNNNESVGKESQYKKQLTAKKIESKSDDKDLHPSWAAKQKFKTAITDFKGKKIIFDEDEKRSKPEETTKIVAPTKTVGKSNTTDAVHPSWEAKKKQKCSITAFQGKKITFEDGD
ncbi:uncharacterized protein LOC128864783 [Anastrepha ludens]|uniref:uncharacterized protein LOC128864783 n=1 Tax=Anastrepha ludens TaxID=28586 RepID=UPI0023AEB713|nr:uncharacterized protein LOC128864783 [Anastrepha ludens]